MTEGADERRAVQAAHNREANRTEYRDLEAGVRFTGHGLAHRREEEQNEPVCVCEASAVWETGVGLRHGPRVGAERGARRFQND